MIGLAAERARADLPPFTQAILDRYLEAHERFVSRQPGGRRAVVKYLQAPDLDFKKRILSDADFTGANFERGNMVRAVLERVSLYCANLRGVDARLADFSRADIRGASLRGANLSGARLDDADMRQAMLARADLPGDFQFWLASDDRSETAETRFSVDLSNCSMKSVKLNSAKLKHANFSGALLQGADLSGADLTGAQFKGAILAGANLDRLKVDPSAFEGCVLDPTQAALERADLLEGRLDQHGRWVETNGREGKPAILDEEDLRPLNAKFVDRALTAMSAKKACAVGVDFSKAQLQGACFDGADLRDANFTSADLRGASFKGALLWHAKFDEADVRPLALAGGLFQSVELEDAQFTPGSFRNSLRR